MYNKEEGEREREWIIMIEHSGSYKHHYFYPLLDEDITSQPCFIKQIWKFELFTVSHRVTPDLYSILLQLKASSPES